MGLMADVGDVIRLRTASEARTPSDAPSRSQLALAWPAALFLIIAFFVGADMAADVLHGMSAAHLAVETFALTLALAGVLGTAFRLRTALREAGDLQRDLEGTRADLPVAIVSAASLPDEGVVRGTLADIARIAVERGLASPAVLLLGSVARQRGTQQQLRDRDLTQPASHSCGNPQPVRPILATPLAAREVARGHDLSPDGRS